MTASPRTSKPPEASGRTPQWSWTATWSPPDDPPTSPHWSRPRRFVRVAARPQCSIQNAHKSLTAFPFSLSTGARTRPTPSEPAPSLRRGGRSMVTQDDRPRFEHSICTEPHAHRGRRNHNWVPTTGAGPRTGRAKATDPVCARWWWPPLPRRAAVANRAATTWGSQHWGLAPQPRTPQTDFGGRTHLGCGPLLPWSRWVR
jgi:hypothetical protein